MMWVWPALLSALFASLTAVTAKIGVAGVSSNLATAIRTTIVLLFTWGIVAAQGRLGEIGTLNRKTWLFLGLSGLATGLSWLCYFYALKIGPVSRVAVVDKLSLALTVLLSVMFLREPGSPQLVLGTALMIAGALIATFRAP